MKLLSKKKISELAVEYFRCCEEDNDFLWKQLYSEVRELCDELQKQKDEQFFIASYFPHLYQIYLATCDKMDALEMPREYAPFPRDMRQIKKMVVTIKKHQQ